MNLDHTILSLILLIPLAGTIALALLPDRGKTMQWGALFVTLATFVATLHRPAHYAATEATGSFRFVQDSAWISVPAIRYHLGVDGLGMWLVVLTGFLAPLGVLASWNKIDQRRKTFYVLFLLQQFGTGAIGFLFSPILFTWLLFIFGERSLACLSL